MRRLFISLVLFASLFHGLARSAPGPAAALFERDWQWRLEHHPEYATTLGERRYNDRLSDTSLAAVRARRDHLRSMLEEARALDRAGLSAQEKLSLDLFVFGKERQLARLAFSPVDPQLLTSWDGLPVRLPRLVAQTPFASEEDYRNYLARLGWSHGDDEFFSTEQMIEWFSLDGLNKGAARFDFVKLENINGHYIREAKPDYLYDVMLALAEEVGRTADLAGLSANKATVLSALPELQPRAKTVLELTGSRSELSFLELPEDDPKVRQPDISKAREVLGWEPKVDLMDGLKVTLDYFRGCPEFAEPEGAGAEGAGAK